MARNGTKSTECIAIYKQPMQCPTVFLFIQYLMIAELVCNVLNHRLCDLVVRLIGYRSGFDSRCYQIF
jgi:hypothetical protein